MWHYGAPTCTYRKNPSHSFPCNFTPQWRSEGLHIDPRQAESYYRNAETVPGCVYKSRNEPISWQASAQKRRKGVCAAQNCCMLKMFNLNLGLWPTCGSAYSVCSQVCIMCSNQWLIHHKIFIHYLMELNVCVRAHFCVCDGRECLSLRCHFVTYHFKVLK